MLFQNRNAGVDAFVTDIHGWSSDKPPNRVGILTAK
jgi:hypothetical protein